MAAVRHVVRVGIVEHGTLQSLIHGPVELQTCLTTAQIAVGIVSELLVSEGVVEDSHLGDVALEALFKRDALCTTHGEREDVGTRVKLTIGGEPVVGVAVFVYQFYPVHGVLRLDEVLVEHMQTVVIDVVVLYVDGRCAFTTITGGELHETGGCAVVDADDGLLAAAPQRHL